MRSAMTVLTIGLVYSLWGAPQPAAKEPAGWEDLMANNLKGWSRAGAGKSPWRMTADNILICAPANDLYVPERLFANGTLKFEYRFRPTGEKTGYKAAVYVRRSPEAAGARIDLGENCGGITNKFISSGDREKTVEELPTESHALPIGEWNTIEIDLQGRSVTVRVNGKPTTSIDQGDRDTGLIAFAVEGREIEFRRIVWKESK